MGTRVKDYGKPFLQTFIEADRDFYKIDHNLLLPAMLTINNVKDSYVFRAGKMSVEALKESFNVADAVS